MSARSHRRAVRSCEARRLAFDSMKDGVAKSGMKRPGSLNPKKSIPPRKK